MAEPRRVTLVVERGQLTFRHHDFLACRHHFVACRHHAAASLGAVLSDSALFLSLNPSLDAGHVSCAASLRDGSRSLRPSPATDARRPERRVGAR